MALKNEVQMKIQIMELLAAAIVLLASCAPAVQPTPQIPAEAIRFEHWATSIGNANAGNSQQILSYQLTLVNTAASDIIVHSIDLILNDAIGKRAAAPDRVIPIDQKLLVRHTSFEG